MGRDAATHETRPTDPNWSLRREIGRALAITARVAIAAALCLFAWWLMAGFSVSFLDGSAHNIFAGLVAFGMFCVALSDIDTPLPRFRRPK